MDGALTSAPRRPSHVPCRWKNRLYRHASGSAGSLGARSRQHLFIICRLRLLPVGAPPGQDIRRQALRALALRPPTGVLTEAPADELTRTLNLRQAVDLYRAALEVYTRDRFPVDFASTTRNLANALTDLPGDAAARAAALTEAVTLYRAALEIFRSDLYPGHHQMTRRNLEKCLSEATALGLGDGYT